MTVSASVASVASVASTFCLLSPDFYLLICQ
jgi:hypothetical protein